MGKRRGKEGSGRRDYGGRAGGGAVGRRRPTCVILMMDEFRKLDERVVFLTLLFGL